MAQKFKLLVGSGKNQVAQTIDIEQAAGPQAKPITVKAQPGMRYQLAQADRPEAPHNVRAKRVGKNLEVFLEDSQQVDLVIENYYDQVPAGVNALVGQAENGSVYTYIPEDANTSGLVPNLTDGGNLVGMALGSSEEFMLAAVPLVAAAGGGLGMGAVAAGVVIAAAAGGGGGGAAQDTTPPSGQTGALATASDSGTTGDNRTNVKTPTITGTAEANAKVEVTLNGKTYTTTADANGNYSVDVPTTDALADGTYTPTIKVTDPAGNSSTVDGTAFTVDTTAPSEQTGVLAQVASSDSGTIGDNRTNVSTPTITGKAEANAKVEVTLNGKNYTTTADANGNYSVSIPAGDAFTDNTYTPQIKVTDAAGNTSTVDGTPFTVDTDAPNAGNAPRVTITTDTNNDGYVNKTELNGATTFAVQAAFDNTKVAVGDVVTFSDGITTKAVTLTQTDMTNGYASTTFAKPAEGVTQTITAYITDAADNQTSSGSDKAMLDTIAPTLTNANVGLAIQITTDTNDDGYVNNAELGSLTALTSHVTVNNSAQAGDKVIISATNDSTALTPITHVLNAADITAKGFNVTFAKPAEGKVQNVSATYADAAGNPSTDAAKTDNATLDTTPPTNSGVGLAIAISTDANDDGYVNTSELNSGSSFTSHVTINSSAVAGDKVVISTTNGSTALTSITYVLTAADITAKGFDVTFTKPSEAATQTVTANYVDAAGNAASDTKPTDSATLDTTAPNTATAGTAGAAPTVIITTDADNDSYVNITELNGGTTFAVKAAFDNTKVAVGDVVTFSDGTTTKTVTLAQADITNGYASTTFTKPAEGATQTITAYITDAAKNQSASGSDSATLDTTVPTNAGVSLAIAINTDANDDGYVNTSELNSGSSFTSHVTINSSAVAGDKVVISASNGSTALTSITHVLTSADITNGFDVTFTKPSEAATQTVTANYVDSAGNAATDTKPTDSATLDTTTPTLTNANVGLAIQITSDTNNDGYVNNSELGSLTSFTSHVSINSSAVAGDKVIISATNDSSSLTSITHVLTAADIAAKGFDVTFNKPAESKVQAVSATYADAAGNFATDAAKTDSATLDSVAPTNAGVGLAIAITTDSNNDGYVNGTESPLRVSSLANRVTFNGNAVEGDKVVLTYSNSNTIKIPAPIIHVLTASEITAGGFNFAFTKPAEGKVQVVSANYQDAAGNLATDTKPSDSAILDSVSPTTTAAITAITTDTGSSNTDFYTNDPTLIFSGTLTSALVTGEKVQISWDNGVNWYDATSPAGSTTWSYNNTANTLVAGDYSLKARVVDAAINASAFGSHALTIDTAADAPTVALASNGYTVNVSGLETGATWQYTTDGGTTWNTGSGTSFDLGIGNSYTANQIEVKQTDKAGNVSAITNMAAVSQVAAPASIDLGSFTDTSTGEVHEVNLLYSGTVDGKAYYYLDGSGNDGAPASGNLTDPAKAGVTQGTGNGSPSSFSWNDFVSHQWLNELFNKGADTTDTTSTRSTPLAGHTIMLPTSAEYQALAAATGQFNMGSAVQAHDGFWTATQVSNNTHDYYQAPSSGLLPGGAVDTSSAFAVFQLI